MMVALARQTLLYEWRRYLPAVLSVGFAGLLLLVQAALVLGIFGTAALPVRASSADIWAGFPGTQSVNFGRQVDADVATRLWQDPAVRQVEAYQWVDGDWYAERLSSGSVAVFLSGVSTRADALMFSRLLSPVLRARLREPGAVIVDRADLATLGLDGPGGRAWINRHPVHVVAALPGLRGLGGANVLASLDTARRIAGDAAAGGATYYVASLHEPALASQVAARLNAAPGQVGPMAVWPAEVFARRSQQYWLLDTGAGVAVLFMALMVCLVGAVITNQSLAAAVAGNLREYATLHALGVSRLALARVVVAQSGWIGVIGLALAAVCGTALLTLAQYYQVPVALTPLAALACAGALAVMTLLSSLMAVRGVWRIDPAQLLR